MPPSLRKKTQLPYARTHLCCGHDASLLDDLVLVKAFAAQQTAYVPQQVVNIAYRGGNLRNVTPSALSRRT